MNGTPVVVIDVETTGLSEEAGDRIVELGMVRLRPDLSVESEYSTLINPRRPMGAGHIHGIREVDVRDAPAFEDVAGDVGEFLAGSAIAAHNAAFDLRFLFSEFEHVGLAAKLPADHSLAVIDTLEWSRQLLSDVPNYKLTTVCEACGVPDWSKHGALSDAKAAAALLARLADLSGRRILEVPSSALAALPRGWTGRTTGRKPCPRRTLSGPSRPSADAAAPSARPPPLAGEVAVFTGGVALTREDATRVAEMLGCAVRTGVTGKTSILVVGDPDVSRWTNHGSGPTSKHRAAMERAESGQRLRVLSESDLLRLAEVVSDGIITEQEWHAVRDLVYTPTFPPRGSAATAAPRKAQPKKPQERGPTQEAQLKATALLAKAQPQSPQHTVQVLQQFSEQILDDIHSFSGQHSMAEYGEFVRALGVVPGALNKFLEEAPGGKNVGPDLVRSVSTMILDVVQQVLVGLRALPTEAKAAAETKAALESAQVVARMLGGSAG